jgi:hypothetical protein
MGWKASSTRSNSQRFLNVMNLAFDHMKKGREKCPNHFHLSFQALAMHICSQESLGKDSENCKHERKHGKHVNYRYTTIPNRSSMALAIQPFLKTPLLVSNAQMMCLH